MQRVAVTGPWGYSGRAITRLLLDAGHEVIGLTNHPPAVDNLFEGQVQACPFCFDDPDKLQRTLGGCDVLINTYWIRFDHREPGLEFTHATAVRNTEILFAAAKSAGVRRVVHTSITRPGLNTPWPYFQGKARLENVLKESGLSYAILRPAVFFGGEDILVNNLAFMLRRLPVFGLPGDGSYGIRPLHVDDMARLVIRSAAREDSFTIDAVGPERYSYRQLVEMIARELNLTRLILPMPPTVVLATARLFSVFLDDVLLTREEIEAMMGNHLDSDGPAAGSVRLSHWVRARRNILGRHYHSELARRRK